jgi:hypothetical protein
VADVRGALQDKSTGDKVIFSVRREARRRRWLLPLASAPRHCHSRCPLATWLALPGSAPGGHHAGATEGPGPDPRPWRGHR